MAGQTKVNGRSQSDDRPMEALRENVGGFAHDTITLAELQVRLFKADIGRATAGVMRASVLAVVALCLLLACFPVLLLAGGQALADATGMAPPLGWLLAGVAGAVVAAGTGWLAWRWTRSRFRELENSRQEFQRNLNWIKGVLKARGGSHEVRSPR